MFSLCELFWDPFSLQIFTIVVLTKEAHLYAFTSICLFCVMELSEYIDCHVLHINFRIIKHVTEAIMLSCTGNHENCQYMLLGNKLTILVDLLLCRLQVRVCHVTEFVPSLKHLVQNKSNGIKIMLQNRVSSFFRIYEARLSHLVTSLLPQPTFICSKPTM